MKFDFKWIIILVLTLLLIGETGAFIYVQKNNNGNIATLSNELTLLGKQLDDSKLIVGQLRDQNRQLDDQLSSANKSSADLARQLSAANTNLAIITDQLRSSNKLTQQLKDQFNAALGNISDLNGQLVASQQYSDELAKQLANSAANIAAIKSIVANIVTDSTDAKSIIGELRQIFKQLQSAFDGSSN